MRQAVNSYTKKILAVASAIDCFSGEASVFAHDSDSAPAHNFV